MWLLVALLLLPVIEIGLFIQVGGWIGLWPTIGLVILSAVAGVAVMRRQGASVMADLQRATAEMRDPTAPIAHGAMVLIGGVLLLIPGFLTDLAGIALLVPPLRRRIIAAAGRRIETVRATRGARGRAGFGRPAGRAAPGDVVEGEYTEIAAGGTDLPGSDTAPGAARGTSGWTRH